MTEDEKNEIIEKWSKLGLTQGLDNQIIGSIDPIENTNDNSFESISFPIIRRVMSLDKIKKTTIKRRSN